jgi:outer membrane protein OmpA-like peptidoglycan-associated protein
MIRLTRSLTAMLALGLAVGSLTGCRTMNENRTATGGVAGAVVGGTAGALIDGDNRWRGALIGAAAGGALGGGIGYVLQQQKDAFDRIEELEARPQRVVIQQYAAPTVDPQTGATTADPYPQEILSDALLVTISSEVLFTVGSSALSPHGANKVREVAAVLKQYPDSDVYIRGYSSSEGDYQANFDLSRRRAQVVRNELIAAGVPSNRLWSEGMGISNPVASNDTEAGRVLNRRVELHIVPRPTAG